jgi:hypothetical protein
VPNPIPSRPSGHCMEYQPKTARRARNDVAQGEKPQQHDKCRHIAQKLNAHVVGDETSDECGSSDKRRPKGDKKLARVKTPS